MCGSSSVLHYGTGARKVALHRLKWRLERPAVVEDQAIPYSMRWPPLQVSSNGNPT